MGTNLFDVMPIELQQAGALNGVIIWLQDQQITVRTREIHLLTWSKQFNVQLVASDYYALGQPPTIGA